MTLPSGTKWLLLVYKVPSEPTRFRASVSRRVKGLGAVYLRNGVAVAPTSIANERGFRALRHEVLSLGGEALLLRAQSLAGEDSVIGTFNAARDEEYGEIVDRCAAFEVEIEREMGVDHLTYGDLEENDEDLTRLKAWLAKVQKRDVLGAARAGAAAEAVVHCEHALDRFAAAVYATDRV
jgi:hypothetical protein